MRTTSRVWTYEDYLKLEEEERYEIIEGGLYHVPGTSRKHQEVTLELATTFRSYIKSKDLGKLYISPFDVVLSEEKTSSLKKDTEDKRRLYASYGVKEFWLVFPREKVVEVFSLEGTEYRVRSWAYEEGQVCSKLLDGFCVRLEEVLSD
ncbi:MAG: Uma2 family endonuclease [Aquificaceae bacterium]|nr:Uma2 family endonuclease [Aquificaceae bacterium]